MSAYIFLAGRILYALPLIILGSNHFLKRSDMVATATAQGLPVPQITVIVSGLVILLGAISVLMGYRGKTGAWLVAVALCGTAFLLHPFWGVADSAVMQLESSQFFKDLALAGAALMMTRTGTGPYSVDNLRKKAA